MKSIVLFGLKHSGKSSVASCLSRRMGLRCVDTDRLICEEFGFKSAREAFKARGKTGFKDLEYRACVVAAELARRERLIVATGGGIADNSPAMEQLSSFAATIYLRESADVLYERFMRKGRPAFLSEEKPAEEWARIYARRDRLYASRASLIIECSNRSIEEIADEIEYAR